MFPRWRQTLLFLICAVVLLGVGYGWGYAVAFTQYYSLSELMDRETLDLEFNSRLLHYFDTNQPALVRSKLYHRLTEQVRYVDEIIASSKHRYMAPIAAESLQHARTALSPQRNWGLAPAPAATPVPAIPAEPTARDLPPSLQIEQAVNPQAAQHPEPALNPNANARTQAVPAN